MFSGYPRHVTPRGNGRAQTFFDDEDYAAYRDLLATHCAAADVTVWAWMLMPNHVHLIVAPSDPDGIRRALAPAHRRYAGWVHARMRRTGHFWQGRFGCVAMDDAHVFAAIGYVLLDPVRAGLVLRAEDRACASVHAHLGASDGVTATAPVAERVADLRALLSAGEDADRTARLRRAEMIGDPACLIGLEQFSGRGLAPQKRGPKPGREKSVHCYRNSGLADDGPIVVVMPSTGIVADLARNVVRDDGFGSRARNRSAVAAA